jgi:RHS repeat-associated protein
LLTSLTNPTSGAIQSSSTYAYDPLMRLAVIDSSNSALDASLGYDGQDFVYEGLSGNRTRRYVRGPRVDEPLVAYLVTPTGTSRNWYQADERGSIVRQSNDSGTPGAIGKYDEYGVGGLGRIRYAGQYWLADGNLLYSRARIYDARLGRFLQPDPIGYGGGINMYAYVKGDPVNFTDPLGLEGESIEVCGGVRDSKGRCISATALTGGAALLGSEYGSSDGRSWNHLLLGPVLIGNPAECTNEACDEAAVTAKAEQCTAPQIVGSYGISGTLAAVLGINGSATINVGVPTNFTLRDPLRGVQLSATSQAGVLAGYGIFAGFGEQIQLGLSSQPMRPGVSSGSSYFAEVDAGAGPSIGASAQVATDGSSASGALGGKLGTGIGIFFGGGKSASFNFAAAPVGC